MTNDTEHDTEALEPFTAHELLSVRTITVSVAEAARLTAEHRAALTDRAEARADVERLQLDNKLLGDLAQTATKRADQAHGDREAIKARLQPAAQKWQALVEQLREQFPEHATNDVDRLLELVAIGVAVVRKTDDTPAEVIDAVAAPAFLEQATELIAQGARPVDAVETAMAPVEEAREAVPPLEVSEMFAPVGARVRLEHADGYGYRKFAGCYGDVVALHPSYQTLRMVQWTGDDRPRPTHVRRITVVDGLPQDDPTDEVTA